MAEKLTMHSINHDPQRREIFKGKGVFSDTDQNIFSPTASMGTIPIKGDMIVGECTLGKGGK